MQSELWFMLAGRHWPDAPTELYFTSHEIAAQGEAGDIYRWRTPPRFTGFSRLPEIWDVHHAPDQCHVAQSKSVKGIKTAELGRLFVSFPFVDPCLRSGGKRAQTHSLTVSGIKAALADGFVGLNAVVTQENHCLLTEHAELCVVLVSLSR